VGRRRRRAHRGAAAGAADPETSTEATANPVVRERLLSDETEQAFLSRWAEIQDGFVEDPVASVRDADRLIDEIATAQLSSFQERRNDLAHCPEPALAGALPAVVECP
jgi:hypothetical protein